MLSRCWCLCCSAGDDGGGAGPVLATVVFCLSIYFFGGLHHTFTTIPCCVLPSHRLSWLPNPFTTVPSLDNALMFVLDCEFCLKPPYT